MMNEETEHKTAEDVKIPPPLPGKKELAGFVREHPRWVMIGLAVVLVALLIVALPKRNTDKPPGKRRATSIKVLVVQPRKQVVDSFTIHGTVEPNRVVRISAEVAARVDAYAGRKDGFDKQKCQPIRRSPEAGKVEEGVPVRRGQPILYLNNDLLRARRDLARTNMEFDRREYERILALYEKQVATQAEKDRAKTRWEVSKSTHAEARANLERAHVLAPIDGTLNRLAVEEGEYVQPGMVVAEIVDMDTAVVALDVPEQDVGYLNVRQEGRVYLDTRERPTGEGESNPSGEEGWVAGTLQYISETADPAAHTTRVEVRVENKPDTNGRRILHDGQIVRVRLVRRELADVIMIPLGAVIPLEKGYVVYVSVGGKAERREIDLDASLLRGREVGVRRPTEEQLREAKKRKVKLGLWPGDRLIVEGHKEVGEKQPVKEQEARPEARPTSMPAAAPQEEEGNDAD